MSFVANISNDGGEGLQISGAGGQAADVVIANCVLIGNANPVGLADGILCDAVARVVISGNTIRNFGRYGITPRSAPDAIVRICDNEISGGIRSIYVANGILGAQTFRSLAIENNTVIDNTASGAIRTDGTTITNLKVCNNRCIRAGAGANDYAIIIGGTVTYGDIRDNDLEGAIITIAGCRSRNNRFLGATGFFARALAADQLEGSVVWDPASLAAGATVTSAAITCTGVEVGDYVQVAPPYTLQGIIATAYANAGNSVIIVLFNPTAGAIDLGSGTWRVRAEKQI
jgi:putative cofactor-binding repeat protein